jgi:hypothetical protein
MAVHGFNGQQLVLTRQLVSPALVEHAQQRAESVQNRIPDRITAFAGSMRFRARVRSPDLMDCHVEDTRPVVDGPTAVGAAAVVAETQVRRESERCREIEPRVALSRKHSISFGGLAALRSATWSCTGSSTASSKTDMASGRRSATFTSTGLKQRDG